MNRMECKATYNGLMSRWHVMDTKHRECSRPPCLSIHSDGDTLCPICHAHCPNDSPIHHFKSTKEPDARAIGIGIWAFHGCVMVCRVVTPRWVSGVVGLGEKHVRITLMHANYHMTSHMTTKNTK